MTYGHREGDSLRMPCCSRNRMVRNYVRRNNSCSSVVTMMQATESWHGYDLPRRLGRPSRNSSTGRFFSQRKMRPVFVIVADILFHKSSQMTFVQHDDMIEQVSSTVANPALGNAVLPRTSETSSLGFDAQGLDRVYHLTVEVRRPIKDQVFRRRIVGESLSQLLRDPTHSLYGV